MNIIEATDYISNERGSGGQTGFGRMYEVMEKLGNPQNNMKYVHIAGTNGKGSTYAMVANILKCAGYKVGLYTSPHLIKYNERFKFNNIDMSDEDFIEGAELIAAAEATMADKLTVFEKMTALGFWFFNKKGCDIVSLEVGLGGRLDCTNIIQPPEVAIIAHLALDHTHILGDTLEQIAYEKAGIIKPGSDVVLFAQEPNAEAVVKAKAEECGCRITVTDPSLQACTSASLEGQIIDYRDRKGLKLALIGNYQYKNTAGVLDAIDALIRRGWNISEDAIREGLATVVWPARFQLLQKDPVILLDGAHNPDGATELVQCLETYLPGKKMNFVMGVMADKDYQNVLEITAPYAKSYVAVQTHSYRALDRSELGDLISAKGIPVTVAGSVEEGIDIAVKAQKPDEIVVIFGSLYLAGDALAHFGKKASAEE